MVAPTATERRRAASLMQKAQRRRDSTADAPPRLILRAPILSPFIAFALCQQLFVQIYGICRCRGVVQSCGSLNCRVSECLSRRRLLSAVKRLVIHTVIVLVCAGVRGFYKRPDELAIGSCYRGFRVGFDLSMTLW